MKTVDYSDCKALFALQPSKDAASEGPEPRVSSRGGGAGPGTQRRSPAPWGGLPSLPRPPLSRPHVPGTPRSSGAAAQAARPRNVSSGDQGSAPPGCAAERGKDGGMQGEKGARSPFGSRGCEMLF